jgi:hypothetical protein
METSPGFPQRVTGDRDVAITSAWAHRLEAYRAKVVLSDAQFPIDVELTGWSLLQPGDADSSSLPVTALQYRFSSRAARRGVLVQR